MEEFRNKGKGEGRFRAEDSEVSEDLRIAACGSRRTRDVSSVRRWIEDTFSLSIVARSATATSIQAIVWNISGVTCHCKGRP